MCQCLPAVNYNEFLSMGSHWESYCGPIWIRISQESGIIRKILFFITFDDVLTMLFLMLEHIQGIFFFFVSAFWPLWGCRLMIVWIHNLADVTDYIHVGASLCLLEGFLGVWLQSFSPYFLSMFTQAGMCSCFLKFCSIFYWFSM